MTSQPRWEPTDQYDLLAVLADDGSILPSRADVPALFLAACRRDAMSNGGYVSVNRVRDLLAGEAIHPRRYSALWSHFTGAGKPMVKTREWEVCKGSASGNDGRPFALRRWVG